MPRSVDSTAWKSFDVEDLDITLHHLAHENGQDWSISDQALQLDNAAALVTCIRDDTAWHSPRNMDFSGFSLTGKGVQYSVVPPSICERECGSKLKLAPVRDWGEPVQPDEDEWVLEDVEEFDHGPLRGLIAEVVCTRVAREPSAAVAVEVLPEVIATHDAQGQIRPEKRKTSRDASVPQVQKRPRFDEGSLFDALPHPHFQACLMTFDIEEPWQPFVHAEFYSAAPIPIPPHTQMTMEEHISDVFSRLAWVIPVRGHLPWEGATPASILADPPDDGTPEKQVPIPEAPYQNPHGPSLVWTRDALRAFWQFLQELRDVDNLGPLGLAFYHPPVSHASSVDEVLYVGSHKQDSTSQPDQEDSAIEALEVPRSTLCQIDYIKVYHDARNTKVLRNILNAWAYRRPGVKVRMLKGATLALLDECEKGLLLC